MTADHIAARQAELMFRLGGADFAQISQASLHTLKTRYLQKTDWISRFGVKLVDVSVPSQVRTSASVADHKVPTSFSAMKSASSSLPASSVPAPSSSQSPSSLWSSYLSLSPSLSWPSSSLSAPSSSSASLLVNPSTHSSTESPLATRITAHEIPKTAHDPEQWKLQLQQESRVLKVPDTDPISDLHVYFSKRGLLDPQYSIVSLSQAPQIPVFECTCTLGTGEKFTTTGQSKKRAKKSAAEMAWAFLMHRSYK
jgi:hypothetical protein